MSRRPASSGTLRLLIVGHGDIGRRVAQRLPARLDVRATTREPGRVPVLRSQGVRPLVADLDDAASLRRLGALAPRVLYLAPPAASGDADLRLARLLAVLRAAGAIERFVYVSTTGVWGHAGGAWVDETRPLKPMTARARRRVDAERQLRRWARQTGVAVAILRAPGIYAPDRPGGDPLARVRAGAPLLRPQDDVFTNHVHADDLARACRAALFAPTARGGRSFIVSDDDRRTMGDYYTALADRAGLPRPPRISRAEAALVLSPMAMSFLGESRRLRNDRARRELGGWLQHRWPEHALFGDETLPASASPDAGGLDGKIG